MLIGVSFCRSLIPFLVLSILDDCIGPLELFVTLIRCYVYAFFFCGVVVLKPSAGGEITLSQIVFIGAITSYPLVMKWHNCTH